VKHPPCGHESLRENCNLCRWAMQSEKHRTLWGMEGPPPGLPGGSIRREPAECRHFGRAVPAAERDRLSLDVRKDWHHCLHPARPKGEHVCRCEGCGANCPGYDGGTLDPAAVLPIDARKLSRGRAGFALNAGLIRHAGRLLLAYRTDWAGAHCHVAELADDLTPVRTVGLAELRHPRADHGREDPRLFTFRGRLHVAYIGVQGAPKGVVTHQMYARLTDDLRVEEVFYPDYAFRRAWEKNWSFFEWENELFAVYSIAPHVVLHVKGNKAYPFAETPTRFPWSGGHLRGGAPPVRVGEHYWHWFHGRLDANYRYNVGLCVFEARPPFNVVALSPDPLYWADGLNTDGNYCPVVFPCGAVLEGGRWRVSCGWNDRGIRVLEWNHATVAAEMGVPA
jgi:predicted GH43/DUF377 family glycosyl hydrolase